MTEPSVELLRQYIRTFSTNRRGTKFTKTFAYFIWETAGLHDFEARRRRPKFLAKIEAMVSTTSAGSYKCEVVPEGFL